MAEFITRNCFPHISIPIIYTSIILRLSLLYTLKFIIIVWVNKPISKDES